MLRFPGFSYGTVSLLRKRTIFSFTQFWAKVYNIMYLASDNIERATSLVFYLSKGQHVITVSAFTLQNL